MPRPKTVKVKEYTPENLRDAVEAVKTKRMALREAARHYKVPKSVIFDHLHGLVGSSQVGHPTFFTPEEESRMATFVMVMAVMCQPLQRREVGDMGARLLLKCHKDGRYATLPEGRPGETLEYIPPIKCNVRMCP